MRTTVKALAVVVALGSTASAAPVNLLTHTPAVVAVSSAVDSAKYLPEHLVDGDKTTAWNSAPGDSGWIAFTVPITAHVDSIKMTVGFTARDWFKQNLRIQTVTVEHDGKRTQVHLDPESKELQTIKVDGTGGTYKIAVYNTVPGTNKDWNEIVVSELEVWGTAPETKVQKPRVIIGDLDFDCVSALWPKAKGRIAGAVRDVDYRDPFCIVDRLLDKDGSHTTTIALMHGDAVSDKLEEHGGAEQHATIADFKLGSEVAVMLTAESSHQGEMTDSTSATHTLYRIASGKFVPVTSYDTSSEHVEQSGESHECTLTVGAAGKQLPELVLSCEDGSSDAEGHPTPVKKWGTKLHWTGKRYE